MNSPVRSITLTTLAATLLAAPALAAPTYQQVVLGDNPISYFRFEGNANDLGGGANNGTNNGVVFENTSPFTAGTQSLGQYAQVSNSASISLGAADATGSLANDLLGASAITVEAWIDFGSITTTGALLDIRTSAASGNLGLQVRLTTGGLVGINARATNDTGAAELTSTGNTGKRHVVMIADFANKDAFIYIDGTVAVSNMSMTYGGDAFNITPGSTDITIGAGGAGNLAANFDELAIYNYALTPTQISNHFQAIPEPASLALAGLGALMMMARRRR